MPAMSPTMTEGGIVAWKVKEGELFSSGDVLLEVETDKATIDVEAQDDGQMWRLLEKDGASGIPVGRAIAFLAEPDDDLAALKEPEVEAPKQEEKPAEEKKEPEPKPEQKEEPKSTTSAPASSKSASSVFTKADASQKLMPSVELLLHKHHISAADALEKIPASGPKGRLLYGDILAYVGEIDQLAVAKVAEYIKSKEHLDLSNIKIAAPKVPEQKKAAAPAQKPKPSNILSIEFTSELGEGVSPEKFQYAFEKALEGAKRQTYATRFPQYSRSPLASPLVEDDIFGDLLVALPTKERFAVSNVAYEFIGEAAPGAVAPVDDFDALLGLSSQPVSFEATGSISAHVSFQVTFDQKVGDSRDFVEEFQESLLSQIPAKQLIIRS